MRVEDDFFNFVFIVLFIELCDLSVRPDICFYFAYRHSSLILQYSIIVVLLIQTRNAFSNLGALGCVGFNSQNFP